MGVAGYGEQWTYQITILRHIDRIMLSIQNVMDYGAQKSEYNMINLRYMIEGLDVMLNNDSNERKPIPAPVELKDEYLRSSSPYEQAKYLSALLSWLRQIIPNLKDFKLMPLKEVEFVFPGGRPDDDRETGTVDKG